MAVTTDPMEGITPKTSKADLLDRLNQLADVIRGHNKQQTSRLAEIERRVREQRKPHDRGPWQRVLFVATPAEMDDALGFLTEFEDVLPIALDRLVAGAKLLKEQRDA